MDTNITSKKTVEIELGDSLDDLNLDEGTEKGDLDQDLINQDLIILQKNMELFEDNYNISIKEVCGDQCDQPDGYFTDKPENPEFFTSLVQLACIVKDFRYMFSRNKHVVGNPVIDAVRSGNFNEGTLKSYVMRKCNEKLTVWQYCNYFFKTISEDFLDLFKIKLFNKLRETIYWYTITIKLRKSDDLINLINEALEGFTVEAMNQYLVIVVRKFHYEMHIKHFEYVDTRDIRNYNKTLENYRYIFIGALIFVQLYHGCYFYTRHAREKSIKALGNTNIYKGEFEDYDELKSMKVLLFKRKPEGHTYVKRKYKKTIRIARVAETFYQNNRYNGRI